MPVMDTSTLVRGARDRDPECVDALARRLQPWMLAYVRPRWPRSGPVDAEDVVAEVWLEIVKRLPTFQVDGGAPGRQFRAYAIKTLANRIIDRRRRALQTPAPVAELRSSVLDPSADVVIHASAREGAALLRSLVDHLPDDERRLLLVRGLHDEPAETAARELGISVDAAHKRWQRLRARLQAQLPPALLEFFDDGE
jgi:RNA polymerase sigma factor (sigma-70 family)